jgi:hypothetical protein
LIAGPDHNERDKLGANPAANDYQQAMTQLILSRSRRAFTLPLLMALLSLFWIGLTLLIAGLD